jgi:hypothetical protein
MAETILRTADQGCFEIYNGTWGSYLRPTFDPDANAEITADQFKHFELKDGIHKIPAELWQAWVQLCFYYVEKVPSTLEVSVRILRNEEDNSQYRILVPKQEVSSASVRVKTFDSAIDIVTGEEIESYPPTGWIPVGSSHSHNTMPSFFSDTDNEYELKDPGIHLVIGSINNSKKTYTIASSVVGSGRRFLVNYDSLIDATPVSGITFHEKVLEYVTVERPRANLTLPPNKNYNVRSQGIYQEWHNKTYKDKRDFDDPFFFQDGSVSSEFWGTYDKEPENVGVKTWNIKDAIQDYILDNRLNDEDIAAFIQMMTPIVGYIRDNHQNQTKMRALSTLIRSELQDLEVWGNELSVTIS